MKYHKNWKVVYLSLVPLEAAQKWSSDLQWLRSHPVPLVRGGVLSLLEQPDKARLWLPVVWELRGPEHPNAIWSLEFIWIKVEVEASVPAGQPGLPRLPPLS